MTSLKDLGLKVGIEIHQQLEGKKLFCSCPTTLREDKPDFTITRKLRAVAGEGGEIDIAAGQEQEKRKAFVYEGYQDTTCLVEADEEPPHCLNNDALYTCLQFAALVNATVIPVIQVMRKTVVDGSNTSGFQRTALIARKGVIDLNGKKIRIAAVCLEEDACRISADAATERTYRLDRLGIPLIEIGTEPDISSPQECLEVARKLGMLLRSLPGVKRGLGTIRQDVNVSIAGGTRIEIKGAQELKQLPLLVELEAKRQSVLLKIAHDLSSVKLAAPLLKDVSGMFKPSPSAIISSALKKGGVVLGLRLAGVAGFLGKEVQPARRLGTEFSERAEAIAGVGGIFHSDELPQYGITEKNVAELQKLLGCRSKDAFVVVADKKDNAEKALQAVYLRVKETFQGVPAEVRKANDDGTTSYLRPMPGAARMYPETDVPLIYPDTTNIELPELLEKKIQRYQKERGLSKDLAEFVAKSDKVHLFEELVQKYPSIKPAFIAETLTSTLLDIKRQYGHDPEKLTEHHFRNLFRYLAENKIHKDIVLDVLIDMLTGQFDPAKYAALGTEEIHKVLKEIIRNNAGAPFPALMGLAMKQLQGKASGKFISEQLKKLVEKGH